MITVLLLSNVVLFVAVSLLFNRLENKSKKIPELIRAQALFHYTQQYPEPTAPQSIAVIIPAYREAENIEYVLARLPKQLFEYSIVPIVVVDGQEDETAKIVQAMNQHVALHLLNCGQGAALKTGFAIAIHHAYSIVMTMDADGQHRVEDMPSLLEPIIRQEAEYVMGSRFLGEYEDRGGLRHLGIVFFSWIISRLSGQQITDCANGFRAIRVDKLASLTLHEERFNAPELILQAARQGLRIKEVPTSILSRRHGESKKPPRLGYPLGFGIAIIRTWLRSFS